MPELSQAEVVLGRLLPPPRGHHRQLRPQIQPGRDTDADNTPPRTHGEPARRSAGRPPTAPVDALGLLAALEGGGLQARVRAAVSRYPYGASLPATRELADEIGESYEHVRAALGALEAAGEIAPHGRQHRYRLRPGELHPKDVDFDQAVREGIATRQYAPGSALPAGLLGRRHGVSPLRIARACRGLIADRLVTHRDGHAGPGYYVTPAPSTNLTGRPTSAQQGRGTDCD